MIKSIRWPRGGMVTQRIANPFIPVRFWAWPPVKLDIMMIDKEIFKIASNTLNYGFLKNHSHKSSSKSSICGDSIKIYLKVPINYFFEDFSEYLLNLEKSKEGHMNVNYNFLVKVYSELTQDQKIKFSKNIQLSQPSITKVV